MTSAIWAKKFSGLRKTSLPIIVGLLTVGGLYMPANVAYFRVLLFAYVAGSSHIASDVVQSFAGSLGAT
jgi:hypothetical protein